MLSLHLRGRSSKQICSSQSWYLFLNLYRTLSIMQNFIVPSSAKLSLLHSDIIFVFPGHTIFFNTSFCCYHIFLFFFHIWDLLLMYLEVCCSGSSVLSGVHRNEGMMYSITFHIFNTLTWRTMTAECVLLYVVFSPHSGRRVDLFAFFLCVSMVASPWSYLPSVGRFVMTSDYRAFMVDWNCAQDSVLTN